MMSRGKTTRIESGARLHFGLLDTSPPFGGLGVMIDQPATVIEVAPSDRFVVDRELKERAFPIAERFCRVSGRTTLPEVELKVLHRSPMHCGFGSGTQLSLCIAEALRCFCESKISDESLSIEIADRGKRSAVGVHGFFHGGLIFESSDDECGSLNKIQQRVELPSDWRLVLLRPRCDSAAVSGDQERQKFATLQPDVAATTALRNKTTHEIIPAAQAGDFDAFAEAIESYNHASGMLFAKAQGGPYNGPVVTELVESLKTQGATGVGQSSWGPGVFAWCEDESSAHSLAAKFDGPAIETLIATVRHEGRRVQVVE